VLAMVRGEVGVVRGGGGFGVVERLEFVVEE